MKKVYKVNGVEVAEKPSNGEEYERLLVIGEHVLERNTYQATTPEQRELEKIEGERAWRNAELDYIDSKNYSPSHTYKAEIDAYIQELKDYPASEGFPNTRPTRPLTPSGQQVITGVTNDY